MPNSAKAFRSHLVEAQSFLEIIDRPAFELRLLRNRLPTWDNSWGNETFRTNNADQPNIGIADVFEPDPAFCCKRVTHYGPQPQTTTISPCGKTRQSANSLKSAHLFDDINH